ncbi:Abi-domain-containing protein [Guyanagaster necrorhizus]|uniref:intramembrane prenyl-peptidase Rce1 n=1 Tax=Guyanagaster necrorhizus TaxID=856835 RepID=A0A9P7VRZ1_9AGAR|nr:Abi-domain-containing protein [Guyanagaster necrorhizus MCA 3950]KAG7445568.1 Abi-domain-containing protein [Guyanagaster necrorhizus MCA 3950]
MVTAGPLSSSQATLLALFFASSYVGSLYISKNARLSFVSKTVKVSEGESRQKQEKERWRDDPDVIRARLTAVVSSTVVSCLVVYWVRLKAFSTASEARADTLERLGFTAPHPVVAHLITPVLFLGPLFAMSLYRTLPFQKMFNRNNSAWNAFYSIIGLRTFVVAPLTEETVFRACMLSVYHLSGASAYRMIFLAPLWFGLAHVHHAWDAYNRFGRTNAALKRAIIIIAFQMTYTTLFGFHCSYLFLRTGSIWPPITAHVFCNIMGVPGLQQELRHFPSKTFLILMAYVLGVIGYISTLGVWSATENSIYWSQSQPLVQPR